MVTPRTTRTTTDSGSNTVPVLPISRPAWFADALCAEPAVVAEVGMHLVDAERNREAKARAMQVCGRCLVRTDCLEYALANDRLVGIFGGTDTAARRAIRSNRSRLTEENASATA